jgi:hypothetical protein
MKQKSTQALLAVLFGTGFFAAEVRAQNTFFEPGDLILFFQKPGDDDTIYVGLGSARTLYRGSAAGPTADRQALNIVNIDAALTAAYGAGWASDTGIYVGLAGCRSATTGTQVFEGDQTRTLYVSRARNGVGTLGAVNSIPWDLTTAGTSTSAATAIVSSLSNDFEVNHLTKVATSLTSSSKIDDENPFIAAGVQGFALNGFSGGVQQRGSGTSFGTFGPAGSVEFALDLNRIVPRNDSETNNEISGVKEVGSYEGTIVVGTDGKVSFITQAVAPTSAYDAWLVGFPLLVTPTDKLPETDFDNDGYTNLEEFVLNGNPSVSGQAIAPILNATGANFVFDFTRRADSTTEVTQIFEYSTNLLDWTTHTPIAIPTTPGTVGFVTVGANSGTAPNELQAVTLSIPKGSNTRLFGRLKMVK